MDYIKRAEVEYSEEWEKWRYEIPYIKFDKEWEIKVIPPFAGAIVRFIVRSGDSSISVYLDCYDKLGCFGEPYWEMYPHKNGDVYRVRMNNVEELVNQIRESL